MIAAKAERISWMVQGQILNTESYNGQSAAKLRTGESSTTIPPEGSRGKRSEVDETLTRYDEGQDIVCACVKAQEVHKRTVSGVAPRYERQTPNRMATGSSQRVLKKFHILNLILCSFVDF